MAVICGIILNNTKAGRYILCLGSNQEAVRLSGVDVKKWKLLAFVICGTLAGFAQQYLFYGIREYGVDFLLQRNAGVC